MEKGSISRSDSGIYDVHYYPVITITYNAEENNKRKIIYCFPDHMLGWNYDCRIYVQHNTKYITDLRVKR